MIHQIQFVSEDGQLAWPKGTDFPQHYATANTVRRGTKWAEQVRTGDLVELVVCKEPHPGKKCNAGDCVGHGYALVLWTEVETYARALKFHAHTNHVAHLEEYIDVGYNEKRSLSSVELLDRSMRAAYGVLGSHEVVTVVCLARVNNIPECVLRNATWNVDQ